MQQRQNNVSHLLLGTRQFFWAPNETQGGGFRGRAGGYFRRRHRAGSASRGMGQPDAGLDDVDLERGATRRPFRGLAARPIT